MINVVCVCCAEVFCLWGVIHHLHGVWELNYDKFKIKAVVLLFLLLCMGVETGLNSKSYVSVLVIIENILTVLVTASLFKKELSYKLFILLFNLLLAFMINGFLWSLARIILNMEIADMEKNPVIFVILTIISCISYYNIIQVVSIILRRSKGYINGGKMREISFIILSFLLAVSSFCYLMYHDDNRFIIAIVTVILGIMLITTIMFFLVVEREVNTQVHTRNLILNSLKLENEKNHYKALYQSQLETRRLWHDMKNHLVTIQGLLLQQEYDCAVQYMERLTGSMEKFVDQVNTISPALNAIMRYKIHIAREKGYELEYKFVLPKHLVVDELELSMLIGNLLDNAIEACDKLPTYITKKITLKIFSRYDNIGIEVKNPVDHMIDVHNLTSDKSDLINHGIGLDNIRVIVAKYDGVIDFECNQNLFIVQVFLNNYAKDQ